MLLVLSLHKRVKHAQRKLFKHIYRKQYLMKADHYFFNIFEASVTPTVVLAGQFPQLIIDEANAAFASLVGGTVTGLKGEAFLQDSTFAAAYQNNEALEELQYSISTVFATKTATKTTAQAFVKPTSAGGPSALCFIEVNSFPIIDDKGEVAFTVCTIQDVSHSICANDSEAPADDLAKASTLHQTKADFIGTWEIDEHCQLKWSNALYQLMELAPGTAITVEDATAFLNRKFDRAILIQNLKRLRISGEAFEMVLNVVTAKGNERWLTFTAKADFDKGKFVSMHGSVQHITDKRILHQQLAEINYKLEGFIENADGVAFECSANTLACTFFSQEVEVLLGYTLDECNSDAAFLKQIIHPEDYHKLFGYTAVENESLKHVAEEFRVFTKDGALRWVKLSISLIRIEGALKWLRGLMIDITPAKRLFELERIEKEVLELNASPNATTTDVLKNYLEGLESIFPEMHCSIMQRRNGYLYNWVANALPKAYLAAINQLHIQDNTGSCGTAAFRNETIIVSDISTDPLWKDYKAVALKFGLKACWSHPIRDRNNNVIATLGMYYKTAKKPTPEQSKIVERIAHMLQVILQHRQNISLLEATNQTMEQSQQMAHLGSIHFDINSRVLNWSKELYHIFELAHHVKPTVELYYGYLHPEDREQVRAIIARAIATRSDFTTEGRILLPNGQIKYLQGWGKVKLDEQGEATAIIATYLDITERKKIEHQLIQSESRLRSLIDAATSYVVRINAESKYTYTNKTYQEDFANAQGGSLVGMDAISLIVEHQRESVLAITETCVNSPGEVFEIELDKYSNDGTIKTTFWHFVSLPQADGGGLEVQCTGLDITDYKVAQREKEKKSIELQQSEKRYNDLFHLSPHAMFVYDAKTLRFLDVNQAALKKYGYSKEEFNQLKMSDIQKDKKPEVGQFQDQLFYQRVYTHRLKSGEEVIVDTKVKTIPFKTGTAKLVSAVNITEAVNYLKALQRQNELLSSIAWIQSHEVRAPLTRIMGLVDLLQNHDNTDTEKAFIMTQIQISASALDNIIIEIVRKAEQADTFVNSK